MARVLLLGEGESAVRYLTGALAHGGHAVRHVPARTRLDGTDEPFDVVVLSDYPSAQLGPAAAATIVRAIEEGAGLVMIGGWTSFTGRGGDWGRSPLAPLLPVVCAAEDDRRNVASGVWLEAAAPGHPLLAGLDFGAPPVVCGYNAVTLAGGATLVARGRLVVFREGAPALGGAVPLLAARVAGRGRAVAYMSDLTPHWCGGLVDWGRTRLRLAGGAEVGDLYIAFVLNLIGWASGARG
jgi:uncharacterized membrane protein